MSSLILIAAGGTGGHLFPGLAVAEEIMARHQNARIEFVGSTAPLGLERKIVPKSGFKLHLLPVYPLKAISFAASIKGLLALPWGFVKALALVLQERPNAVLGVGGYASGPVVLAASLLRVPSLLLEPNAIPGFTNRMLNPFVRHAACAFQEALPRFGARAVLTGNPVRASFKSLPQRPHERPLRLLWFGGSQGSRVLSEALVRALPDLPDASVLTIVHQTGASQLEGITSAYAAAGRTATITPFIDDMSRAFAVADLVLCRAGATTLAELTVAGKAAILVPLKSAADDHQTWNARAFVATGAALMLAERDLDQLASVITSLLADPQQIVAIEERSRALGRADAAARVADLIEPWLGGDRA